MVPAKLKSRLVLTLNNYLDIFFFPTNRWALLSFVSSHIFFHTAQIAHFYPRNTKIHDSLRPPPLWNTVSNEKKRNCKKRSIKGNCITELQWGTGLESTTEDHISGIYLQGPCSLWAAIRYIQLIFHNWLNLFFFSFFFCLQYSTLWGVHYSH